MLTISFQDLDFFFAQKLADSNRLLRHVVTSNHEGAKTCEDRRQTELAARITMMYTESERK